MKTYIVKVDDYGNKLWHLNDKLHREDGMAKNTLKLTGSSKLKRLRRLVLAR